MNKEEWVEYFRAVNGRDPEPQEFMAALQAGEIVRETSAQAGPAPQAQGQLPPGQAAYYQAPVYQQAKANSNLKWILLAVAGVVLAFFLFGRGGSSPLSLGGGQELSGTWTTTYDGADVTLTAENGRFTVSAGTFGFNMDLFEGTVDPAKKEMTITGITGEDVLLGFGVDSEQLSQVGGTVVTYNQSGDDLTLTVQGQSLTLTRQTE